MSLVLHRIVLLTVVTVGVMVLTERPEPRTHAQRARRIVSGENPLAARVVVNHFWQRCHLLDIDHYRLTHRFQGLDFKLTGVEPSRVVHEILS